MYSNLIRLSICLCISLLLGIQNTKAQEGQKSDLTFIDDGHRGFHMSIYGFTTVGLGDEKKDFHFLSPGLDFDHQFNDLLGIIIQMNTHFGPYNSWYWPVHVGPKIVFQRNPKIMTSIVGGVGPSVVAGNDYASFFASINLGLRSELAIHKTNKLIFGVSYNQGMFLHSDSFNVLNLLIGLRFF